MAQNSPQIQLPEPEEAFLEEHISFVKTQIINRARELAVEENDTIRPKHVARAAQEFAPGRRFPEDLSWARVILSSISGVTIISALLAVVFASMGFLDERRRR